MAIHNTAYLSSKISDEQGLQVDVSTKSNVFIVNNLNTDFIVKKQFPKNWVIADETIKVTTTITNNTNITISDIFVQDELSEDATFVEGSVILGSQSFPEYNPITGFNFQTTIGPMGGEFDMTYDIKVNKYPNQNNITSSTTVNFSIDSAPFSIKSNEASVQILDNEITLSKSANTRVVKTGDEITYTILVSNDGTVTNTNVMFKDAIPQGTTFVENSVKLDGETKEGYNPETGFELKNLNAGDSVSVEFRVKVN